MDHQSEKNIYMPNRLGFHYFPDAHHFSEKHVNQWLPILEAMKVGWLVLSSPLTHAIPEDFIRAMSSKKVNLIVDFQHSLNTDIDWPGLETLIQAYGKWGVKYAVLNRYANMRASWGNNRWGNQSLIISYADQFRQFAEIALENSLRPVLGPLAPGGDYWDIAFLQTALTHIHRSAVDVVKNNLTLSSFAWDFGRSLDWGNGGPASWPLAGPYTKPEMDTQNQQGFRTYEWYDAISRTVFGRSLPIILFDAGISSGLNTAAEFSAESDLEKQLSIYGLIKGRNVYQQQDLLLAPLHPQVIACNYFVLSASEKEFLPFQWFCEDGHRLEPAQAIFVREGILDEILTEPVLSESPIENPNFNFKHRRYVLILDKLLPSAAEILEKLHTFIEKHKPLVGFSIEEASEAAVITVITPDGELDPLVMNELKSKGGLVRVIRPEEIPSLLLEKKHENA